MADTIEAQVGEVEQHSNGAAPNLESLATRAKERRRQLEHRHTTTIEPPGYQGIVAIEYRVLPYSDIRLIAKRHERLTDDATLELYTAADSLIMASINSYAIEEDGERRPLGLRWGADLAKALGVELDESFTARRALFACFPRDVQVITHYSDYSTWLQEVEEDLDREQGEDFPASR